MEANLDSYLSELENEAASMEYFPEPEKIWSYSGLNYLNRDEDLMQNITTVDFIHIIPYHVNTHCAKPFLEFALVKSFEENQKDQFSFITFPRITIKNMKEDCKIIADSFVSGYCSADKVNFSGFLNNNGSLYIFYQLEIVNNFSTGLFRITPIWFVTVDEIVNKRSVCNMPIDESLSEFFMDFIDLTLLKNENGEFIETPSVFYTGTHYKNLKFDSIFSRGASDNSIFGKYFYFTDYKNSVKEGGWTKNNQSLEVHGKKVTEDKSVHGRFTRGGIIRYAVFLKNGKILFNNINEPEDNANEDELTRRITDYNGTWSNEYDSILVGRPTLDNGNVFSDGPILAVKDYNQFLPLSYHYINKATLGESWDRHNNDYFIE
jgi:hypothetical protein